MADLLTLEQARRLRFGCKLRMTNFKHTPLSFIQQKRNAAKVYTFIQLYQAGGDTFLIVQDAATGVQGTWLYWRFSLYYDDWWDIWGT